MAKYEVWNEVLCFRTSQRIFHLEKALKLLHSLSFASLQCSCLISGAPEEWFPSLFLAHIMKRKPNPLMGDTGYKKNAHWIEIKKLLPYFHQLTEFCLQKKHYMYFILFSSGNPVDIFRLPHLLKAKHSLTLIPPSESWCSVYLSPWWFSGYTLFWWK